MIWTQKREVSERGDFSVENALVYSANWWMLIPLTLLQCLLIPEEGNLIGPIHLQIEKMLQINIFLEQAFFIGKFD